MWPLIHFVNYKYVRPQLRVPFVSTAAFFWYDLAINGLDVCLVTTAFQESPNLIVWTVLIDWRESLMIATAHCSPLCRSVFLILQAKGTLTVKWTRQHGVEWLLQLQAVSQRFELRSAWNTIRGVEVPVQEIQLSALGWLLCEIVDFSYSEKLQEIQLWVNLYTRL